MRSWRMQSFQSGTVIVAPLHGPVWLTVYGQPQSLRLRSAIELEAALSTPDSVRPWMRSLKRQGRYSAQADNGISLSATGPKYDANPPNLDWRVEDSAAARQMREGFITNVLYTLLGEARIQPWGVCICGYGMWRQDFNGPVCKMCSRAWKVGPEWVLDKKAVEERLREECEAQLEEMMLDVTLSKEALRGKVDDATLLSSGDASRHYCDIDRKHRTDVSLLAYAVRAAVHLNPGKTRQFNVSRHFGLGLTAARRLCERFGLDPEAMGTE